MANLLYSCNSKARESQSSGCFEFCFFNLIEPNQAIELTKQYQKHILPNQLDNMFFFQNTNLTQLFIKYKIVFKTKFNKVDKNIYFLNRDFEDGTSLDGSIEHMERGSIASFGSGNTTDSDNKVNLT